MTPEQIAESLALDWSVRVFVDSVSYSNPLPVWHETVGFRYSEVARRVEEKIAGHIRGTEQVTSPYRLKVPYRINDVRTWLLPSLTEQIILQACAAKLGKQIPSSPDKIFSYQYRPDNDSFLENQLDRWVGFQTETLNRLQTHKYVLQLDIKRAFASIQRQKFFSFLRSQSGDEEVVRLLERLLNSWMGEQPGLPLINDSLYFLGNGYFHTLDQALSNHTQNFIRFVDDYRIFGDSRAELEQLFESINRDINQLGFAINDTKVRLGQQSDYFKTVSKLEKIEDSYEDEEYFGPLLFKRVVDPGQLVRIIKTMVSEPEKYLTVRLGRFVLREIRKFRSNGEQGSAALEQYRNTLLAEQSLRRSMRDLISRYATSPDNQWRLVWLLYVTHDIVLHDRNSEEMRSISEVAQHLEKNSIAGLWAKRIMTEPRRPRPIDGDRFAYMDADYLKEGTLLYGESQ